MSVAFDKEMEKIRKKIRGVENWTRGHIIENMAIADDVSRGYEIRPTGKGSDYMRRRVNPITEKIIIPNIIRLIAKRCFIIKLPR